MLKRKCCECGKWFREDDMIQDSCGLIPPAQNEWCCEKCFITRKKERMASQVLFSGKIDVKGKGVI